MSLWNLCIFEHTAQQGIKMAIVIECPKFKHIDQAMTLIIQVDIEVAMKNWGYKAFHQKVAQELQIQQSFKINRSIKRYHDKRERNRINDTTVEFKCKRNHS